MNLLSKICLNIYLLCWLIQNFSFNFATNVYEQEDFSIENNKQANISNQTITKNLQQVSRRQLLACHSFCMTCAGPSFIECLSCNNDKYYISYNKQCILCQSGQYGDNKRQQCRNCAQHCLSCTGPDYSDCQSCNISESFQSNVNKSCISCLEGQYGDNFIQSCILCHQSCKSCNGPGNNHCISCYENYVYDEKAHLCASKEIIELPYDQLLVQMMSIQVPSIHLADIRAYSFSLWYRFSYYDPVRMKINVLRLNQLGIGGITEKDNYCYNNIHQSRTLSVFYQTYLQEYPQYIFQTYNQNNGNFLNSQYMNFDKEIHDSEWNWIYFGYSYLLSEAYAYSYFSRNEQIQSLKWSNVAHSSLIPSLKFMLGQCGNDLSANGLYFDVRFRYDQNAYINTQEELSSYMDFRVQRPLRIWPMYQQIQLLCGEARFKLDDQLGREYFYKNQFRGAEEYAIFGWMKWVSDPMKGPWHIVYRLTTNEDYENANELGDRTLGLWIAQDWLDFQSYSYKLQSGETIWNVKKMYYSNFNLNEWIFVYQGYSFEKKMCHILVKFIDQEMRSTFYEYWHFKPKSFSIFLAKDKFYPAYNGYLKDWEFAVGEGAFKIW